MAEEEFTQQVGLSYQNARFYTQERLSEFTSVLNSVANNTLVVVKNVELFDKEVFNLVHKHSKLIISGDVEETNFKKDLILHPFVTRIYFSELESVEIPQLEKYSGYVEAGEYKGVTKLG